MYFQQTEDTVKSLPVGLGDKVKASTRPIHSPYETESEDEPVLYRDSCITPPSAFASPPESDLESIPRGVSPPPPLPISAPPSLQGTLEVAVGSEKSDIINKELIDQKHCAIDNDTMLSSVRSDSSYQSSLTGTGENQELQKLVHGKNFNLTEISLNSTGYDAQSELSRSGSPERLSAQKDEFDSLKESLTSLQEESDDLDVEDPLNTGVYFTILH